MSQESEAWHINKSIPVAVIFTMIVQTCAIVWGAAKLEARVENIEHWVQVNSETQLRLQGLDFWKDELNKRVQKLENRK
jgi:hypothetical protein